MGKIIDMTGWVMKEHGVPDSKLTVIEKAKEKAKDAQILWACQCECGTRTIVPGCKIRNGHTKSCGCLKEKNRKEAGKRTYNNLTDQQFGLLTVMYDTGQKTKNGNVIWHCKCQCGKEKDFPGGYLTSGDTQSCGCLTVSHGELKINQILIENNIDFIQEYKPKDPNLSFDARFDFYIPSFNVLIEYDGEQHFHSVEHYGGEKEYKVRKAHDEEKNQWAFDNGIILIRIPYTHYDDLSMEDLAPASSTFIINKKIKYIPRKH